MKRTGSTGFLLALAVICTMAGAGQAAAQGRVGRNGTIGIGVSGLYGGITGDSRYGNDFDSGFGVTFNGRYVLNEHWSLGLGFFAQSYDATPERRAEGFTKLKASTIVFETYYYRNRRADAAQYLLLGLGVYRPEVHVSGEALVLFPSENLILEAGLGVEVFIVESFGLELSGRVYGYLGEGYAPQELDEVDPSGNFSIGFQGQVGILYYVLN